MNVCCGEGREESRDDDAAGGAGDLTSDVSNPNTEPADGKDESLKLELKGRGERVKLKGADEPWEMEGAGERCEVERVGE